VVRENWLVEKIVLKVSILRPLTFPEKKKTYKTLSNLIGGISCPKKRMILISYLNTEKVCF